MNINSREALATSLLAEVVYADLPANAIGTGETAQHGLIAALLQSDTVDVAMVEEVGRRYALLSVYDGDFTGFYAAVFQDRATRQLYLAIRGTDATSPLDLINDVAVVGGVAGGPFNQAESLRRYVAQIRTEQAAGTLPTGALTLTGHSLGGYLVQRAVFEYAGLAAAAYTFNSAGIGGLLGLSGGARYLLSSENQFVQNFIAEPGLSVVSSWLSGLRPGLEFATFIEDQSGNNAPGGTPESTSSNHGIGPLVDALGVYRVLDLLAHGGQSFAQLTALLTATTRFSLDTLESTLVSIGQFFGVEADAQYTDPRARMHELAFRLIDVLEGSAASGTGVLNLLGLEPDALARAAGEDTAQGLAVRHALMHGLPFAVTGVDYGLSVNADGRYDRERFSDEYLRARAEYAQLLFIANDRDTTQLPARALDPGTSFRDAATDTLLAADANPGGGQTVFGRGLDAVAASADDRLSGTPHADRLFGAAGDDFIEAGNGDDLLDGGPGNDTLVAGGGTNTLQGGGGADVYVIDAGSAYTLIRGDDGLGDAPERDRILVARDGVEFRLGSRPIERVSDGSGAYVDDAGNRYVPAGAGLRVQLYEGGTIEIENFASGNFGLELGSVRSLEPPAAASRYTVQPLADVLSSPTTGRYGVLGWSSPGALFVTGAEEVVTAIAPVITAPGAETQFVSVAAGFGDSQLIGDDGFNYLIDDQAMGEGALVGSYGLGAVVGDDVLIGAGGDDWLVTQGGSDRVFGGDGNDVLIDSHATWDLEASTQRGTPTRWGFDSTDWVAATGHASDDEMLGEAGNDYLVAHGGDQVMEGGPGNDELYAGAGHDVLLGGAGDDVLGGDIRAGDVLLRVTGTTPSGYREMFFDGDRLEHDLRYFGGDQLDGGDGNDVLFGGGGADVLDGGSGDDALFGDFTTPYGVAATWAAGLRSGLRNLPTLPADAHGDDRIAGGAGADSIDAGGGHDDVDGGIGSDTVQGGAGDDSLHGGSGADTLYGDPASDAGGRDSLHGDDGDDQLHGFAGDDELYGDSGSDVLQGGAGDDVLAGGASPGAIDTLLGGPGDDTYRLSAGGRVQIDDASGANRIEYGAAAAAAPLAVRREAGLVRLEFGSDEPVVVSTATFSALQEIEYADGTVLDRTGLERAFIPGSVTDGRVVLAAGVSFEEIGVRARNQDLLLTYSGSVASWVDTSTLDARGIAFRLADGDAVGLDAGTSVLVLPNWFRAEPSTYVRELVVPGQSPVSFLPDALAALRIFEGSGNADDVAGTDGVDALHGGDGDDLLRGGPGDDLLHGGAGTDLLAGGPGDDRYEFNAGDGGKLISDDGGTRDIVVLGADIDPAMLAVAETQFGLDIRIGSGADRLLLTGWSRGSADSVDALQFADGTWLDRAALDRLNAGNHSPRVAGEIPEQILRAGSSFRFVLPAGLFSDADPGDTLAYELRGVDGVAVPSWLAFDAATQSFVGTPPASAAGSHALAVAARDSGGLMNEVPLSIRVTSAVVLLGTDGPDVLRASGTQAHDIVGLAGNDRLFGAGGDDRLEGGPGDDRLDGAAGADTLAGGPGNDTYTIDSITDQVIEQPGGGIDVLLTGITVSLPAEVEQLTLTGSYAISGTGNALDNALLGNAANNTLNGGDGDDQLDGGTSGADTLQGGAGDDFYVVNSTTDRVVEHAGQGVDRVRSTVSWTLGPDIENLELVGTAAINAIGNALDNVLVGSTRQNLLDGGAGADTMAGGAGNDTYVVDNIGDRVTELANEGVDLVRAGASFTLPEHVEHLTLTGNAAIDGAGNALDNTLTGNAAANRLAGGAGNDLYIVDHAGDVVVEWAGEGNDQVRSSVSFVLGEHVEQLLLTGTASIDGTGNALDNLLAGNNATNVLTGGAGNDTYVIDRATDAVVEKAGEGVDEIRSRATFTLPVNVENLVLEGTAAINGTGNPIDNRLTGNLASNTLYGGAGDDRIDGGAGADRMYGGVGNDSYRVNSTTDQVFENAGEGIDTVASLADFTLGNNVENLVLEMNAGRGTGNAAANELTGSGADNRLEGLGGSDLLRGGPGQDTLIGGDGADRYLYASGDGNDTVSNVSGDAAIDRLVFTDLTLAELVFRRETDDLLVGNVRVAGQAVRVTGWFLGAQNQVDYFDTADGLATPAAAIATRLAPSAADPVPSMDSGPHAIASNSQDAYSVPSVAGPSTAVAVDLAYTRMVHALAAFRDWSGEMPLGHGNTMHATEAAAWMSVGAVARELAA